MKKTPLHWPGALWFPWFFFFWAVQLVGNLSLMDWSSLSERLSAQPIRLIWSCRIAFFGVKTPCQTLGLRSFVLQNEIDRAAATGGMPAGRLNCGDWRAIMNCRAEIAAPLLHYKCSLLTVICNQWAQAFCQSFQIRQAALLARSGRSQETCLLCSQMKLFDGSIVPIPLLRLQTLERKKIIGWVSVPFEYALGQMPTCSSHLDMGLYKTSAFQPNGRSGKYILHTSYSQAEI